ncbi:dipeptidase PepE [Flavobacterium salilacus subsp. salilacus]|uniref:dipeptidase PepE n=1 Tax=Flavobacterium TaxID=237 RepID=UPI001074DD0D|nr:MULTISPECIES: dipeptidase PepE [Flavobacterium]KAF2518140.1 dipeptidase PepE [Flavobacterium salilacus subsp. salilacus]MBE1615550.1 dipeptidase PepE [Flavobacterium sp. SaA2.13]
MKKLIIASTSTLHGGSYLDYLLPVLKKHFGNCSTLLFVPYARPGGITHEAYTAKAVEVFAKINITVKGIHEYENPVMAVQQAEGIFTGGGNTFLLVTQLYKTGTMDAIEKAVQHGTPYLGTSAGSNICGLTMNTTNDMPIVYPPSFRTLGLIPFNINPHYLDPLPDSTHMGETRETRIKEFHQFNTQPVLGLREGSWLEVQGKAITLKGELQARLFRQGQEPEEIETGTDLSWLK